MCKFFHMFHPIVYLYKTLFLTCIMYTVQYVQCTMYNIHHVPVCTMLFLASKYTALLIQIYAGQTICSQLLTLYSIRMFVMESVILKCHII